MLNKNALKCLKMHEKRSDLIRQKYEERIKSLSERIQNAEDEKQAAVTKLSKTLPFHFLHSLFLHLQIPLHVIIIMSKI